LEEGKKDRTGKITKGYIPPIWGEAPTEAIYIKNCVVGDLLDVIMCAKFQNEIFRGYHFTGVKFSIFLLIMVALCNRTDHYIFALWFLSSFFFYNFLNESYNSAALLRCL